MHGHFWSPGKDGGDTIGSAIPENLMLRANLMALSFLEPELWAIEFYVVCIEFYSFFAPVTSTLT